MSYYHDKALEDMHLAIEAESADRKIEELAKLQLKAVSLGKQGEDQVAEILSELGFKYVLRDLYLPLKNGGYTQIDFLIISEDAMFSIEVKNMSGKIKGKPSDQMWTEKTKSGKYKFYNPIIQSSAHAWALKSIMHQSWFIQPVVVFSDSADISGLELNTCATDVIFMRDLKNYFETYKSPIKLGESRMQNLYDFFKAYEGLEDQLLESHKKRIQEKKESYVRKSKSSNKN